MEEINRCLVSVGRGDVPPSRPLIGLDIFAFSAVLCSENGHRSTFSFIDLAFTNRYVSLGNHIKIEE